MLLANFNPHQLLKLILQQLQQEKKIPVEELLKIYYQSQKEKTLPLSIFAQKLPPTAALCKYLSENEELSNREIAKILHLQEKSVWATLARAKRKMKAKFSFGEEKYILPLSLFSHPSLSLLESVVSYLHQIYHLKNPQIAKLLHKSPNSIAVLAKRGREKKNE